MQTAGPTTTLPESLFEQIIPRLLAVLDHTQRSDSTATPQAKQALLQATNDYKNTLSQAKEYAAHLPGGELNADEQKALIDMLERLREHKKQQLSIFSERVSSVLSSSGQSEMVEIDSTASTPVGS
ncbi:hypothetical protein SCLCIDRAFT_1224966 [Scleroderma citrinum Foug A]|uniref:Mediator of RNA polymerase II transcription subunit 9 n=1 Tax=Scleroderma citrinum Foug A TaxID=1036808 RepID=A0A0C2YMJ5_9AGAM|nr:hypothetical protein SCLCIDRAFT_1224966 [Scleroderma citrinum Foug A]